VGGPTNTTDNILVGGGAVHIVLAGAGKKEQDTELAQLTANS